MNPMYVICMVPMLSPYGSYVVPWMGPMLVLCMVPTYVYPRMVPILVSWMAPLLVLCMVPGSLYGFKVGSCTVFSYFLCCASCFSNGFL
jgi:hypothetical protein